MREAAAFSRRAKISDSVRPGRVQGSFLKLKGWDWDVLVLVQGRMGEWEWGESGGRFRGGLRFGGGVGESWRICGGG